MVKKTEKKNSDQSDHYDFIVIGSGPAGIAAAVQAAKMDQKVAIIEKSKNTIGGAWLHTGTIPSKTIREVLDALQNIKPHMGEKWVGRLVHSLSSQHLVRRAGEVSQEEQDLFHNHLESNGIALIRGYGMIESSNTIRVIPENQVAFLLKAKKIMIATGSMPRRPAEIPFDGWRVVDSDGILRLETLPKSISIYGAGVIGCEYACIFGALGVDTTLIDGRKMIMQELDQEVTSELKKSMESLGIKILLGQRLRSITTQRSHAVVHLEKDQVEAEVCFFAAGRVSSTRNMGLERLGIQTNDRGAIIVDDYFQTSAPNIYAAGDAIGPPALASTSLEQGRIAAAHAFGDSTRKFPNIYPIGIYTIPEMSSVGKTEEQLIHAGIPYVVGRASYGEVARGYIRGDKHGLLKILICPESKKLYGVHIVGSDAANLIHIGMCFMLSELPITEMIDSVVFNYPTLAEAYRVAAFNAVNKTLTKTQEKKKNSEHAA